MRHLTSTLLLLLLVVAGPSSAQDSGERTSAVDDDAVEQVPETETEPESTGSRDDDFLPTERLRHDQEVDYPTDI